MRATLWILSATASHAKIVHLVSVQRIAEIKGHNRSHDKKLCAKQKSKGAVDALQIRDSSVVPSFRIHLPSLLKDAYKQADVESMVVVATI